MFDYASKSVALILAVFMMTGIPAFALDEPPLQPFEKQDTDTEKDPEIDKANKNDETEESPDSDSDTAVDAEKKEKDDTPSVTDDTPLQSLELSDGTLYSGKVYLTTGAKLNYFSLDTQKHIKLSFTEIKKISFTVTKSEVIRSYRFKEAGSNEKALSGPGYVDQRYEMLITPVKGTPIRSHSMGQAVYVEAGDKRYKYVLRSHHTGKPGESADKLIYVKEIIIQPEKSAKKE